VNTKLRPERQTTARKAATLFSVFIILIFALAATGDSRAQSAPAVKKDYALIYGTVWGPDDHPVAGIPIKIRRASDKKAKWDLMSDRNGEFAQRVPVGTQDYIVQAQVKTPKGQPKPEATVHIDDNERRDVGIHLTKETLSPQ
jgi:predicted nucleotidyltransferase